MLAQTMAPMLEYNRHMMTLMQQQQMMFQSVLGLLGSYKPSIANNVKEMTGEMQAMGPAMSKVADATRDIQCAGDELSQEMWRLCGKDARFTEDGQVDTLEETWRSFAKMGVEFDVKMKEAAASIEKMASLGRPDRKRAQTGGDRATSVRRACDDSATIVSRSCDDRATSVSRSSHDRVTIV